MVSNGDRKVEVGIIGRDGATSLSVVLAGDRANHETYMQVAGAGRRIQAEALRQAMANSASLSNIMLRYANSFLLQVTQTASANACGSIQQRLARWLLMVLDRIEQDTLPITHVFLAVMLAVNRPGVTLALKSLEDSRTVSQKRGFVTITDRAALEAVADPIYAK